MWMAYCYWLSQPRFTETRYHLFIGQTPRIQSKSDTVNVIIPYSFQTKKIDPETIFIQEDSMRSILPQSFDLIWIENQKILRKYNQEIIQSLKNSGKLIVQEYDEYLLNEIWNLDIETMETYFPPYGRFLDSEFQSKKRLKNLMIYSQKKIN